MTIWTPSGERPIRREPAVEETATSLDDRDAPSPEELEEMADRMAAVQEQLVRTPAAVVVANHCIALYELAALHLHQDPPNLADAQLAIDAMGAVVERLGARMGENERPLRDALGQLQMAFVEVKRIAAAGD